jgi:ribosomal protein L7Ae-like RNA K-turn-binding protein
MSYIKFKVPDALKNELKDVVSKIAETRDSKIRKGFNEVTKSIERNQAKLIVMAEDVSPPEILFHVPILCENKSIPYGYISTKKELGNIVRINVGSAAIAIEKVGTNNESALDNIVKKLGELKK